MKKLILLSVTVAAMLSVAAYAKQDPVVVRLESKGACSKIDELRYPKEKFWEDTLKIFNTEWINLAPVQPIAKFDGKPVSFGFDFSCLEHFVYLGDEMILADQSLRVDSVNNKENFVIFQRDNKKKLIDFGNPGAIDELKAMVAAPEGWKTEGLTFGFDMDYIDPKNGDTLLFPTSPCDFKFKVTSPEDVNKAAMLFNHLASDIYLSRSGDYDPTTDSYSTDTLVYFVRPTETLRDYVELFAEVGESWNNEDVEIIYKMAEPNRQHNPLAGTNVMFQIFPVWMSGDVVTLYIASRSTYSVGGGASLEIIYVTLNIGDGHVYTAEDIFKPESLDEVEKLYRRGIYKEVLKYVYEYDPDATEIDKDTVDEIEASFKLINNYYIDKDRRFYGNVALLEDGVSFCYPSSQFSDIGEDPDTCFVIPYAELRNYMRPEIVGMVSAKNATGL